MVRDDQPDTREGQASSLNQRGSILQQARRDARPHLREPTLPGAGLSVRFDGHFRFSRQERNVRRGSDEQGEGASLQLEPMLPGNPDWAGGVGSREAEFPELRGAGRGHDAADVFIMGVEEKEDAVAFSWMAEFVVFVQHAASKLHAETDEAAVPIGLGHFAAFGVPPEHILGKTPAEGFAGEEVFTAEHGIFGTERDQLADEIAEFDPGIGPAPFEPAQAVVLAVAVVVSLLGVPAVITRQQHGHALREKQRGEEIAGLAVAERPDGGVGAFPFLAAVPTVVVVVAVAVVVAIGKVVFVVVADESAQTEPVVAGDEIDAGMGMTAAVVVEIGTAAQAGGEFTGGTGTLPKATDFIAIASIPLGPAGRVVSHLIAAHADVPGFGNELDVVQNGVLANRVEK